MKQTTFLILLSLLLCVFGHLIRDFFLSSCTNYIIDQSIVFTNSWQLPHAVVPYWLFIFSLGVLPFLYLLVSKLAVLNTLRQKCSAMLIILTTGVVFLGLRLALLKFEAIQLYKFQKTIELAVGGEIPHMKFENFNLEFYFALGLLIGTLTALHVFRKKTHPDSSTSKP